MKSFTLAVTAITMILAAGTAASDVVKVDVGFTLNPFFLRVACNEIAAERGGTVVKSERSGEDKTGVCHIDIPRRNVTFTPTPGIVATPGGVVRQPERPPVRQTTPRPPRAKLEMVETGRLWSKAHATERCQALATRKDATWTGVWEKHDANNKAKCQLRFKPAFVVKAISTGKIWSDEHAKRRCSRLAERNDGTWSGVWRDSPDGERGSVCMINVVNTDKPTRQTAPVDQPTTGSQFRSVRNVKAGAIWDGDHAERKCPVVAQNVKGTWTRRWSKTGPGNESVCEVRFSNLSPEPTVPPPTQTPGNTRTRNVAAGPIWDDRQAESKCPVIAANNEAKWTGNWTKTGPGNTSVCEISVVVSTNTTQAPVSQSNSSTVREVAAGGIWDQAQANSKCPVIAANNKARWTGRWRKISVNNDAVCEIDTRI
ncbi:MAG: Unknown protein [uncultured Thiotrichaceae bacterium]|uniref:Mannan-binding protein domain-containing protein n=1 Tax=uncultured Thiotrichaceae bacterium TaxID=298394 RepID=A0A6S6T4Y3_9GAMM|nr:MAG: Unknown protein [uncultured Thiotrichaceae bacterium]